MLGTRSLMLYGENSDNSQLQEIVSTSTHTGFEHHPSSRASLVGSFLAYLIGELPEIARLGCII